MKRTLIRKLVKSINLSHLEDTMYDLGILYSHKYLDEYHPSLHELAVEICDLAEKLLDNDLDDITSEYFRIYRDTDENNEEILKFMFVYNFPA